MDPVHDWTDGELERLERAMAREYGTAAREMRSKLDKFLKGYERELSQRLKALDDTPEAAEALEAWKRDRAADRRYLQGMVDALSRDLEHAQERAMALMEDRVPQIYAENANYGAFEVDRAARVDTAFSLMDEDTARQLIGGGGALFEPPRPDAAKVRAWTDRKLTSAVTQGILQGESIPHIATRVKSVAGMSASAAVRTARTACTGAENAGRVSSYQRAERLGISLRQEWLATLDTRTRDSHRVLDGERVAVGEEFSNGLRFPGDPQGPGREVYNCRCTLVAAVDGVDQSAAARMDRLPQGMSYEEWKEQARARMAGQQVGEPDVVRVPKPSPDPIPAMAEEPAPTPEPPAPEKFKVPKEIRERVDLETASDDWFEYENANWMRDYVRDGTASVTDMNGMKIPLERRQELAAEAELIQREAASTKTQYRTLYRGMVMDADEVRAAFTPGDVYEFDTLTATARERGVASIYANPENSFVEDGVPVIMQIQKGDGIYGFDRDGMEIVLPKGSEFRVVKNWMDESGTVHVELYAKARKKNVGKTWAASR